jgi:hypothetical protein
MIDERARSWIWTIVIPSVVSAFLHARQNPVSKPTVGFRGDGTGLYPESRPPVEWGEKKNVKWRIRVGKGYSSPVFAHGCLYVTSDPPKLTCIDATTGATAGSLVQTADLPPDLGRKPGRTEIPDLPPRLFRADARDR